MKVENEESYLEANKQMRIDDKQGWSLIDN